MTSFANSWGSSIPHMDMHCGIQAQESYMALWKLAMLVMYAKGTSTDFSMLCFRKTIPPIADSAFQTIMNPLSLTHQNISLPVPSDRSTTVRIAR